MVAGVKLIGRLPSFLRNGVGLEQAEAIVTRRLDQRQADFLALARRAIYGSAPSPYRRLLQMIGCELGDLERLIGAGGVEGALHVLFRQGVYLSIDEFKGRRPIVRGPTRVDVQRGDFLNPTTKVRVPRYTSGSRGPQAPASFDLDHVRERAAGVRLYLDARGAVGWRHANWEAPGGGALVHLLEYSLAGARMERWFTPISPTARPVRALPVGRHRLAIGRTAGGDPAAGADARPPRRCAAHRAVDGREAGRG